MASAEHPALGGIRFEDESHDIALARQRSHSRPPRAPSPEPERIRKSFGSDASSSVTGDIEGYDERDFKKKQTFRGWLLMWCVLRLFVSYDNN